MIGNIIGIVSAVIGTWGFCLMLRVRMHRFPAIGISTALCYGIYLLLLFITSSDMFSVFIASVSASLMSELCARWFKAPVTVFLIPTILPFVPGAALYYTIDNFFRGELNDALHFFAVTGKTIGAILLGIITVATIAKCLRNHLRWKKNDPTLKYISGK